MGHMSDYEGELFAELTELAAMISGQNQRYIELGDRISASDSRRNAQNHVAIEQKRHLEDLGELSADLPYQELALAYIDADREINVARQRLETIDEEPDIRKTSAEVFAVRIVELLSWCAEAAEKRVREIQAEVSRIKREQVEGRVRELSQTLGKLSTLYDVAGQAWPVPTAIFIAETPQAGQSVGSTHHAIVTPTEDIAQSDEWVSAETADENRQVERLKKFRERHIYQPDAKRLIAFYLIENANETVTVEALAEFLYKNEEEEKDPFTLRTRITSLLGPKIQGPRTALLLEAEGYSLQYGWRRYFAKSPNNEIKQLGPPQRVYKAIPTSEVKGELQTFEEKEYIDLAAA